MSSIKLLAAAAKAWVNSVPKTHAEACMRAAVQEANSVPNGNHSWLYTPSVVAARDYMAKYYIGQYRKSDGSPEETHPIEVADWTVNHVPKELLNKYSQEFIGYVMYCHDIFENYHDEIINDFIDEKWKAREQELKKIGISESALDKYSYNKETFYQAMLHHYLFDNYPHNIISEFVDRTWKGDPEFKKEAQTLLFLFTDTPGLKGEERLEQQILRANSEDSGLLALGRYWDKTTAFARDHKTTLKKTIPFNGKTKKCFKYTLHRVELVAALKHKAITAEMKESFFLLGEKILSNVLDIYYCRKKNPKRRFFNLRRPSSPFVLELH